jgi:hypothetical protein
MPERHVCYLRSRNRICGRNNPTEHVTRSVKVLFSVRISVIVC